MVEFSFITKECFLDETCDISKWQCRVRPLPDQFIAEPPQVYAVYVMDGGDCIRMVSYAWALRLVFHRYDPEDLYHLSGHDGRYAIEKYGLRPKAGE